MPGIALPASWAPELAIVTNGGGPGVLAADWISELRLQLGCLTPEQAQLLKPQLSPLASLSDLIDISEEAGPAPVPGGHSRRRKGGTRSTACWPSTRPNTAPTVPPWPWRLRRSSRRSASRC